MISLHSAIFHCIDVVFCPNDNINIVRSKPNSVKKLGHGDAHFTCAETVLGWVINNVANTIHLITLHMQKALTLTHEALAHSRVHP